MEEDSFSGAASAIVDTKELFFKQKIDYEAEADFLLTKYIC